MENSSKILQFVHSHQMVAFIKNLRALLLLQILILHTRHHFWAISTTFRHIFMWRVNKVIKLIEKSNFRKKWHDGQFVLEALFHSLIVSQMARKWRLVYKIKSWKSKSDLIFSIRLKLKLLEPYFVRNNCWQCMVYGLTPLCTLYLLPFYLNPGLIHLVFVVYSVVLMPFDMKCESWTFGSWRHC